MKNPRTYRTLIAMLVVGLFVLTGCGTLDLLATLPARVEARIDALEERAADLEMPLQAPVVQEATPQPEPEAVQSPPLSTNMVVAALEDAFTDIYENVSPSVVFLQVWSRGVAEVTMEGLPFEFPFPDEPGQELPLQQGTGSGFVWDREGHIVTNYHVVAGAERIRVTFADGTIVPATVVGTNRDSDLAVLEVDMPADRLMPVTLGDSDSVEVGEVAVAIGNPFGLESTMTVGFISGLGRSLPVNAGIMGGPTYSIPDVIQTDAPINPGNSGGVLLNDQGEVIGVTTAIASGTRSSAGVGFVVPSAIVERVVPVLIEDGTYAVPWLGISGATLVPEIAEAMDLPADQRGVLVAEVLDESPAEEAGVRGSDQQVTIEGQTALVGGDVIVALGDQIVRTFEDLSAYLFRSTEVGEDVGLTVLRDGERVELEVTLQARPADEAPVVIEEEPEAESEEAVAPVWLGIQGLTLIPPIAQVMDLPPDQEGVLVVTVEPEGPADDAGLRGGDMRMTLNGQTLRIGGDVITGWDDEPVTGMDDLRDYLSQAEPRQDITLTILREGRTLDVELTLEARPTP